MRVSVLVMATLALSLAAVRPAQADPKGEIVASLSGLLATIEETTYNGNTVTNSSTGTEIGFSIEAGYNYSIARSFSVEGGLMYWTIADLDRFGPFVSAFYDFSDNKLGLGYFPSGIRAIYRRGFGQSVYGEFTLNGSWADSREYESAAWVGFGVGMSF